MKKRETVPLETEWKYIQSFIELEKLRFDKGCMIQSELQGDISAIRIAPHLLIPLVENAFKHGDFRSTGPVVTIILRIEGNELFFSIKNRVATKSKDETGGVGLVIKLFVSIMRQIVLFILTIILTPHVFAQETKPAYIGPDETCLSSLIKAKTSISHDTLLVYIEESYWWSDRLVYKVLAKKGNDWTAIQLQCRRKKKGDFRSDQTIFEFPADSASLLMQRLQSMDPWSIDINELRPKVEVQDGISYKFELITKEGFKSVDFYDPGTSTVKDQTRGIKNFLNARELFLQMWNYKFRD